MKNDKYYLDKALLEASKGSGLCSPNPAVGAIIVKDCKIIGAGYHRGPGTDHAEVMALKAAGDTAKGATIYVTLEPCCHYGRTPPCTNAIIEVGIVRVVYGEHDSNRHIEDRGEAVLQRAGIDCECLQTPEIKDFYRPYFHWLEKRKPWVIFKLAMSANGFIAGPQGQPLDITGPEVKLFTHEQRMKSDAILTTSRTVIHDDPKLNVRYDNGSIGKRLYIIDRNLVISLDAQVFKSAKSVTLFHNAELSPEQRERYQSHNVRLIRFDDNFDLLFKAIAEEGVIRLWVEAGARLFQLFSEQSHIDELYFYVAKKWFSERYLPAFRFNYLMPKVTSQQIFGDDVVLRTLLS